MPLTKTRSLDRSRAHSASDSHDCCSCTSGGHRQMHPGRRHGHIPAAADGRRHKAAAPGDDGDGAAAAGDALGSHPSSSTLAADHKNSRHCCADVGWIASCRRCWSCCCRALSW